MAQTLAELMVKLSATGKAEVLTALGEIELKTEKTSKAFANFSNVMSAAGIAISAFLTKSIFNFKNTSEQIYKFAHITKLSAEASQQLIYAAGQEEVSIEALQLGFKNLTKAMSTGIDETGQTISAFGALDIKIKDNEENFRSATDVMLDVMDKLKGVGDTTLRNIYISELFGKSSTNLASFLGLTSDQVRQLMERAKELGIVLSAETIKSGKEFGDIMRDAQLVIKNLGITIIVELLPKLKAMNEFIISAVKTFKELPGPIRDVVIALGAMVAVVGTLNTGLRLLGINLGAQGLLGSLWKIGAWLLTNPLGWIVIAIGAITGGIIALDRALKNSTKQAKEHNDELARMAEYEKTLRTIAHLEGQLLEMPKNTKGWKVTSEAIEELYDKLSLLQGITPQYAIVENELTDIIKEKTGAVKELTEAEKDQIREVQRLILLEANHQQQLQQTLRDLLDGKSQTIVATKEEFEIFIQEQKAIENNIIWLRALATAHIDLSDKTTWTTENIEAFNNALNNTPKKVVTLAEALQSFKEQQIDKIWGAIRQGILDLGSTLVGVVGAMFDTDLSNQINNVKAAMGELAAAGKQNTDEYIRLNSQLKQLQKQTPSGLLKDWFSQMIMNVIKLVAQLLIMLAVIKLIDVISGIPGTGGALVKLLSGFDYPKPDAWARKQGRDFGYNFDQGARSRMTSMPNLVPQPINVIIHNANPDTYVEIISKLSIDKKQMLYENAIRPGQLRFENR